MKICKKIVLTAISLISAFSLLVSCSSEKHDGAHTYGEWTITKAPTCTKEGERIKSCTCGESIKEAIPITNHTFSGSNCSVCGASKPATGTLIGNLCPGYDLEYLSIEGKSGTINPDDLRGKVVVLNFWFSTCAPCLAELPYFDQIASEYRDNVVVIAVHNRSLSDMIAPNFFEDEGLSDSDIIFAKDGIGEDYYVETLGFSPSYPSTLILDVNGVIRTRVTGMLSKELLKSYVDAALKAPGIKN